jgi:hypothetical protein
VSYSSLAKQPLTADRLPVAVQVYLRLLGRRRVSECVDDSEREKHELARGWQLLKDSRDPAEGQPKRG